MPRSSIRLGLYKLLCSTVAPVALEGLSRIIRVAPRRGLYSTSRVRIAMNREFCGKPIKNDVLQVLQVLHVAIISRHVLHE